MLNYVEECPTWMSSLEQWFNNDSRVLKLQEFFGYCLSDSRRFEKFLFLTGVDRSGKTTIIEILRKLVCKSSAISFKDLLSNVKIANCIDSNVITLDEGICFKKYKYVDIFNKYDSFKIIKNLVGDNDVSARRLHGKEFVVSTFPKIVIVSNDKAFSDSKIKENVLKIEFDISVIGKEDRELFKKLSNELPGILNWAKEGLARLEAQNGFSK